MPDYKALYFSMFRACERAVSILIEAQQQCEARYLDETDSPLPLIYIAPGPTQENPPPDHPAQEMAEHCAPQQPDETIADSHKIPVQT